MDGEDGIGNDINELVEETQCMKEEEINEINEPKVYKTVMDKMEPMMEEEKLECFSDCLRRVTKVNKTREQENKHNSPPRPREKEKRKRRTKKN